MRYHPEIRALSADGKSRFRTELVMERAEENALEYHGVITNLSDSPAWLERAAVMETEDLREMGLEQGPCTVFRSGRHKNDMPGVFETECLDERLEDVSSVMAETGGETEKGDSRREVVSDHLTILRDRSGLCLALEFLTGRDQMFETRLRMDEQGRLLGISAETVFRIPLEPGASVRTETFRMAVTRNPEEETELFARRKAEIYGSRNTRHPAVFCTWYYYGLTVTLEDVMTNLRIIRDRKLPYDVFQVDEGWEITLGEYEPNDKFGLPMKELADRIHEAGLEAGLWSSPFVAHETATIWQAHPEWILRRKDGSPCLFPMNDTVYYVFDITHPATWDYFRELYHRFTFEWGYTYHKLDFTRAAVIFEDAVFHQPRMTLAQAYYQAVKSIREGMGEEAFFLLCGGLYDPVIGLVDAQRTGSDVLSMWSSSIQTGGKTAPYTIRQSLTRYYMNAWWANDPDAMMIRRNTEMERGLRLTLGLLNDEEVKTLVINQFAGGGILCQTEPLDRISEDRLREWRHQIPVPDRQIRPISMMSGERFPGSVDVYLPKSDVHCVCLINWSDTEEMIPELKLALLPLKPDSRYAVCDFYSGEYRLNVSAGDTAAFSPLKPHSATVLKVEEQKEGKPLIVRSDGHYAMGAECRELCIREGRLRISAPGLSGNETHYTVLLPAGYSFRGKETLEVTILPDRPCVEIPLDQGTGETEIS